MYDEQGNPIYEMVFDGTTGYRDDSFDKEYNDEDQPGANFQPDEDANEI